MRMNRKYLLLPLTLIISGCSQISQIYEPDREDENLTISKVHETIYQEKSYTLTQEEAKYLNGLNNHTVISQEEYYSDESDAYTISDEEQHYLDTQKVSTTLYSIEESQPIQVENQIEIIEESQPILSYEDMKIIESDESVPAYSSMEIIEDNGATLSTNSMEVTENDEAFTKGKAKKIVVLKSQRVLELFDKHGNILSRHRISLGKNSYGAKIKKGDYRTPEGKYRVISKQRDPKYYKKIRISYPNKKDKLRAKKLGVNPGGSITIHAQVPWNWNGKRDNFTLTKDWTEGCIAMTNRGIDMIWDCVSPKTVIEIRE